MSDDERDRVAYRRRFLRAVESDGDDAGDPDDAREPAEASPAARVAARTAPGSSRDRSAGEPRRTNADGVRPRDGDAEADD